MTSGALAFYGTPALPPFTRTDVLAGRVVKVNPALITLTDGLAGTLRPEELQRRVRRQAAAADILTSHPQPPFTSPAAGN